MQLAQIKSDHLYSKVVDFFLLGGISILVLPVLYFFFPPEQSIDPFLRDRIIGLAIILDFLVNFPHFSYSYQLFYKNYPLKFMGKIDSKLRYNFVFAGTIIPLSLLTLLVYGTSQANVAILSAIINIRLFTFGWHYAKQGLGIFSLLARRQNFTLNEFERKIINLNTHSAWIYAWILFNSAIKPGKYFGISFSTLSVPLIVQQISFVCFCITSLLTLAMFIRIYFKTNRLPPLNGVLAYGAAVYLWIIFRFSLGESGTTAIAFLFSPFFHSLQYYAVVHKLKLNQEQGLPSKKNLIIFVISGLTLGALAFSYLPYLLASTVNYDRSALGKNFFKFAFWSFINIHHFFIDNVIWRKESESIRNYLW